jgi:hypothetical protein
MWSSSLLGGLPRRFMWLLLSLKLPWLHWLQLWVLRLYTRRLISRRLLLSFGFLLFFSLLSGTRIVYADTPTPTWLPLYVTPTPAPTNDLGCRAGGAKPEGWGTVTPDVGWAYICRNCISTPTPVKPTTLPCFCATSIASGLGGLFYSTDVPLLTGTPAVTGTPKLCGACSCHNSCSMLWTATPIINTSTPTPTFTPTATPGLDWFSWGSAYALATVNGQDNSGAGAFADGTKLYSNDICGAPNSIGAVAVKNSFTCTAGNCSYFGHNTSYINTNRYDGKVMSADNAAGNNYNQIASAPAGLASMASLMASSLGATRIGIELPQGAYFDWVQPRAHSYAYWGAAGHDDVEIIAVVCHNRMVVKTPTPGPSPTPGPGLGYCSNVNGTAQNKATDLGITLPGVLVGPGTCNTYGGYTIGLSWVSAIGELVGVSVPASIGMPGITLCVKPVRFDNLNIFNMTIDLNLLAQILAAVALVFWIRI